MKCENCGNIIEEKDNFCRKCGSAKLKIFARSNDENIEVVESYDLNNIDPIKIIDNDHDNEVPESENKELFEEVEKADKKSKNFILAGIITLMIILFLVILLIIIISYSLK